MVNTVGRVNFTARLDGRGTERDAENIGRSAGAAAGEGYDKTWSKSFRDSLTREGKAAETRMRGIGEDGGTAFGKAVRDRVEFYLKDARKSFDNLRIDEGFLDQFSKGFDDAGLAAGRLQEQMNTLREQNDITEAQYQRMRTKIDAWAIAQRDLADATNTSNDRSRAEMQVLAALDQRVAEHARARNNLIDVVREHNRVALQASSVWQENDDDVNALTRSIERASGSTGRFSLHWNDLSHNTRQWTLIIGAVMAAMEELSVLGAAAGAGLVGVGAAATSGLIGIGGLAAVITTLNMEVSDLPENLHAVVNEFKAFTPIFGELRNAIATGAFREMPGVFDQLGASLRSLTPDMTALGTSVGRTFGDLARNTRPGTEALEEMRRSVQLAGPNFRSLAGEAGDFGVSFLRAFNNANPLVQQMIGYIDTLGDRFDAFTRSGNFTQWINNSMTTFSALGPLIDSVGRALNDMVTPESVMRTTQFLDSLTEFMPNLSLLLQNLGQLDAFGLIAQLLNEFGQALEPLAEPVGELAAALSGALSIAITQVAENLADIAAAFAPVVEGAANFISALPPDVIAGIANSVVLLAGAFVVLKGAQGIAGAVTALSGLNSMFGASAGAAGKLGNALGGALGKAGMVGLAVGGVVVLSGALEGLYRQMQDTENVARNAVASNQDIGKSYDELGRSVFGLLPAFTDASGALDMLGSVGTDIGSVFPTLAATFTDTGRQASALSKTLSEMDAPLASLARTNLPEASARFADYAEQLGASDKQMLAMINEMPAFQAALIATAETSGLAATDQNILKLALEGTTGASAATTAGIAGVGGASLTTGEAVDVLNEKMSALMEQNFSARDANREYEAALDDLTDSIATNGATLDITTEAGRANEQAVDDLAAAVVANSQAVADNTGDQDAATAAFYAGRDSLIAVMQQFGMTEEQARQYVDALGLVPPTVNTNATLSGIDAVEQALNYAARDRSATIRVYTQSDAWVPGVDRPMASGGILTSPTHVLAGEAGREAFVPLDRPLSQVDESVRWLAAIAQGKATVPMANGGIVGGGGPSIIFGPGSIVVQESGDPYRAANEVAERVIERVRG